MVQMHMPSGFRFVSRKEGVILPSGESMRAPYGLEIIESCLSCPHREERLFCNLTPPAVQKLAAITSAAAYPKGAILFVEGQSPRGVFILCSGRVKLSTSSADGRTLILRISEPGDVLGLSATVTGKPYEHCQGDRTGASEFYGSRRFSALLAGSWRGSIAGSAAAR